MFETIKKILENTPEPNGWWENYPSAFMDGERDVVDVLVDNIESEADKLLFEKAEVVEHHGGEGEGERYWAVWHFPNADTYIKFFGYYYSYDGATLNHYYEVVPEQVQVTRYKAK